jgi:hypothetical protein
MVNKKQIGYSLEGGPLIFSDVFAKNTIFYLFFGHCVLIECLKE